MSYSNLTNEALVMEDVIACSFCQLDLHSTSSFNLLIVRTMPEVTSMHVCFSLRALLEYESFLSYRGAYF